jgi:galactonate dehydratase
MRKIVSAETFVVGVPPPHRGGLNWLFLKLTTNDGVVGWGECNCCMFRERSLVAIIEEVCDLFILNMQDPFNTEQLWTDLYSGDKTPLTKSLSNYRPAGSLGMQAAAAIEMACWDIVGKYLNQPVYNLLGGKVRETLRSYTYILQGWAPGEPPEKAAEAALCYVEEGFTALKLDPIPPYFPQGREVTLEEMHSTDLVLKAIRDAVGTKCDILVGTHGQLSTHSAIRFADMIGEYSPLWFEEPVPPENVAEMARVAASCKTPIATGERLVSKWQFEPLLRHQAASILQPNVGLNGILETKKIAALAEAHYAQVAPWMHCGPVAGAAAIQLDVCMPNFLIQEGIEKWDGFAAEIMEQPIVWKNGEIIPSVSPGLGANLREDVLRKHPPHDYKAVRESGSIDRHHNASAAQYRNRVSG